MPGSSSTTPRAFRHLPRKLAVAGVVFAMGLPVMLGTACSGGGETTAPPAGNADCASDVAGGLVEVYWQ